MDILELNENIVKNDSYNYLNSNKNELFELFPELKKMDGFNQYNPHHIYDLFTHSIKTVDALENKTLLLCITALFHDVGKLDTFKLDEFKIGHFYNHALIGSEKIDELLNGYYDSDFLSKMKLLIRYHDYPIKSKKTIKRALNALGDELILDLMDLKKADLMAHSPKYQYVVTELQQIKLEIIKYIKECKK